MHYMEIDGVYFFDEYDFGSMHERVAFAKLLNTHEKRKEGIPVFVVAKWSDCTRKRPGILKCTDICKIPEILCTNDSKWTPPLTHDYPGNNLWHYTVSSDGRCGNKNDETVELTWEYA